MTEQNERMDLADEIGFVLTRNIPFDWHGREAAEKSRSLVTKVSREIAALRSTASAEPVAWRYQRKVGWEGIWRVSTVETSNQGFEAPDDWRIEPLYVAPPEPTLRSSGEGAEALRLLAAEDDRQSKLHELLETIREQIRLEVATEHRPEGLFKNIQDAVYTMRGRTRLMDDAAITHVLTNSQPSWIDAAARASETVEATSPAKRDYAMEDDVECVFRFEYADGSAFEVMSDNTLFLTWPSGRREERRGKITSRLTRFYGERPDDTPQATAEPTREEIAKQLSALVNAIDIYQFSPEGSIEARHAAQDLADAVDEAKRILSLKPRGEPARESGQ